MMTPLGQLGLSVRAENTLKRHGIKYYEDLIKMTDEELKTVRNLGTRGYGEVTGYLAGKGIYLRSEDE